MCCFKRFLAVAVRRLWVEVHVLQEMPVDFLVDFSLILASRFKVLYLIIIINQLIFYFTVIIILIFSFLNSKNTSDFQ